MKKAEPQRFRLFVPNINSGLGNLFASLTRRSASRAKGKQPPNRSGAGAEPIEITICRF